MNVQILCTLEVSHLQLYNHPHPSTRTDYNFIRGCAESTFMYLAHTSTRHGCGGAAMRCAHLLICPESSVREHVEWRCWVGVRVWVGVWICGCRCGV